MKSSTCTLVAVLAPHLQHPCRLQASRQNYTNRGRLCHQRLRRCPGGSDLPSSSRVPFESHRGQSIGAYRAHKRIWQVGMIMKVRLEAMLKHKNELYPNAKNVKKRFNLANKYFLFLRSRTKEKNEKKRKEMKFNI